MNYPESKSIRGGVWAPNEILRDDDINFVGESQYTNQVATLLDMADGLESSTDRVVSGLTVESDSLMTLTLKPGSAVSAKGAYLTDGTWGFVANAGDTFGVTVPVDTAVAIPTADPTNPRIDIIEVRPVQTEYDEKPRQFKDPITGLVSTSVIETKVEYGFEFQVLEGTAAASPSAPSKTAGWIKLAEVYVEAAATTIGDEKILTVVGSGEWDEDSYDTKYRGPMTNQDSIQVLATYSADDINRLISNVPKDLNGGTLEVDFATASYDLEDVGAAFLYFRNGAIEIQGNGRFCGDPDTELSCDLSLISGINFRYMQNVSVEIKLLKLTNGNFAFIDNINCDLSITDVVRVDAENDTWDSIFVDIQNCQSVDLGLLEIHVSGTATPSYPIGLQNILHITSLPTMDATAIAACDYYGKLSNVVVQDSSNIVNGTVGDIDPTSSNYTLLDQLTGVHSEAEVYRNYITDMKGAAGSTLASSTKKPRVWQNHMAANYDDDGNVDSVLPIAVDGGGLWYMEGSLSNVNGKMSSSNWAGVTGDVFYDGAFSFDGQYGCMIATNTSVLYAVYTSDYGNTWTRTACTGTTISTSGYWVTYFNGYFYLYRSGELNYSTVATPYAFTDIGGTATPLSTVWLTVSDNALWVVGVDAGDIVVQEFTTASTLGAVNRSTISEPGTPGMYSIASKPDDSYHYMVTLDSGMIHLYQATSITGTWTHLESFSPHTSDTMAVYEYAFFWDEVLQSYVFIHPFITMLFGPDLSSGFDPAYARYTASTISLVGSYYYNASWRTLFMPTDANGTVKAGSYVIRGSNNAGDYIHIFANSPEWMDLDDAVISMA